MYLQSAVGYYQDDALVMAMTCQDCKDKGIIAEKEFYAKLKQGCKAEYENARTGVIEETISWAFIRL